MNRAARRYLLGLIADEPILVALSPRARRLRHATELFAFYTGIRGWFIVRPGIMPRRVRVVRGRRS